MTKFEALVASLRERITSGEWKRDDRIPSRLDLAKECGVSPTTVSNAIRQLEKEGVVYVVSSKGVFVTPKERSHLPKEYTVGLKSASWPQDPSGMKRSQLFEELWTAANQCGSHILLMASDRPIDLRRGGGPDGLIFIGGETHEEALNLRNAGFPVITCNQPIGPTALNYVDFNNQEALCEAVRRFLALGHRRIAVLSGFTTVAGYYQKMKARFLETLSEKGALHDFREEYWRFYEHDTTQPEIFHLARKEVEALFDLPEPPTAIFAWVPRVAEYVLEEAARRGISVPEHLSVAGAKVESVASVALSGFTLPYEELAQQLLSEVIATIENPFHHAQKLIPLPYVKGETVGPAPC